MKHFLIINGRIIPAKFVPRNIAVKKTFGGEESSNCKFEEPFCSDADEDEVFPSNVSFSLILKMLCIYSSNHSFNQRLRMMGESTMKDGFMNKYHKSYYTFIMNPDDMAEMGLQDGQTVRVTTKAGSAQIPVEATWQVSRGYAMFPHHYGLTFQGETEGESGNNLSAWDNMDEITGNPCVRFVPCRIEAV